MLAQEDKQGPAQAAAKPMHRSLQYIADKFKLFWRKAGHKFSHPLGVKPEHERYVRIAGQGAFILVGNNHFGYPLLIFMALGVFMYAVWRFWEGVTGQGSDNNFGKFKNFFKYRLSPFVSGCVYCAYGAFCCSLIPRIKHLDTAAQSSGFPQSLAGSAGGDFVIAVLGFAFIIATFTQLQAAFTRNFHYEMKSDLPAWFSYLVIVTGHIGFLGRSGVFLFVGVLMFRTIANPNLSTTNETTIGNALSQLQKTHAGRACLFILGFFLIVYGTFAVLNSYGKVFPTQPPSGVSVREARGLAGPYRPHLDEATPDIEAPLERKKHLGEPAWNHSESRKKLNLEQVELAAISSGAPIVPDPHKLDYAARKEERLQAIRELEAKALAAHQQHSSSPRQMGPGSPQATGSGKVTQGNESSVPVSLAQQGQSSLAPEASSSQAAADVNLIHGDMEDVSLTDSPKIFRAKSTGYSKMP